MIINDLKLDFVRWAVARRTVIFDRRALFEATKTHKVTKRTQALVKRPHIFSAFVSLWQKKCDFRNSIHLNT